VIFGEDRFTLVADVRPSRAPLDVPLLPRGAAADATVIPLVAVDAVVESAAPAPPAAPAPEDPERVFLRVATPDDARAIASIYNDGIASRLATFETVPRSPGDVRGWFDDPAAARFPFLLAVAGDGAVLGWVRGGAYRARACYAGVTDYSIYVATEARGRGVGGMLMAGFLDACQAAGVWKVLGRVFPENAASRALCAAHGFREVGTYERHARLDGVWRDVIIVERLIEANQR
jgi:phosphinothricin acetyltransferase